MSRVEAAPSEGGRRVAWLAVLVLWVFTLPGPAAELRSELVSATLTYATYGLGHPLVFSVWLPGAVGLAVGVLVAGSPLRATASPSSSVLSERLPLLAIAVFGLLSAVSFNVVLGAGVAVAAYLSMARQPSKRTEPAIAENGARLAVLAAPVAFVAFHVLFVASGGWARESLRVGIAVVIVVLLLGARRARALGTARPPRTWGRPSRRWLRRWLPVLGGGGVVGLAMVFQRDRFAATWQFAAVTWMALEPWSERIARPFVRFGVILGCAAAGFGLAALVPWAGLHVGVATAIALATGLALLRSSRRPSGGAVRTAELVWAAPIAALLAVAVPALPAARPPRVEVLDRITSGFETYGLLWNERLGRAHFTSKDEPWIGSVDPLSGALLDRIGVEVFHPQRLSLSTTGRWLVAGGLSGVYRLASDDLGCWVQLQNANNVDVAVSARDLVYVGHESRSRIDTFDLRSGLSSHLDLGPFSLCSHPLGGRVEVGTLLPGVCRFPYAVEYDREQDALFVGDYLAGVFFSRTDVRLGRTTGVSRGYMNLGIVDDPGRHRVFVARPFSSRIDVLRATDLTVVGHWEADFGTRELSYGPTTDLLLAASYVTGRVRAIDAATGITSTVYQRVPKLRAVAIDERDGLVLAGGAGGIYRAPLPEGRGRLAVAPTGGPATAPPRAVDGSCVHQSTPELPEL